MLLLAILILLIVLISVYMAMSSKKSKTNEAYGDVHVEHVTKFHTPLGELKTRFLNSNGVVKIMPLDKVLKEIGPDERLCCLVVDNDIINRRALDSEYPQRHILAPYIEEALGKRGLQLVKNTAFNSDEVIMEAVTKDYVAPLGYWFFVSKKNAT